MSEGTRLELIDSLARTLPDLVASEQRRLPHLTYADVRVEFVEVKSTSAENDGSQSARQSSVLIQWPPACGRWPGNGWSARVTWD